MKTKHKSGFSLIEIMVAAIILAVLALGGAQVLYHTGAVIQKQEQKRMAVDRAMARLELVKRTEYPIMQKQAILSFPDSVYLVDDGDNMLESGELQSASGSENDPQGRFPMVTAITYVPKTATETESLQVGVSVTYDTRTGQQVMLDTIIVPDL